jgi:hypothetical protein
MKVKALRLAKRYAEAEAALPDASVDTRLWPGPKAWALERQAERLERHHHPDRAAKWRAAARENWRRLSLLDETGEIAVVSSGQADGALTVNR